MASNLLVTGKWGEVHVTSAQQRNFNSGVVGDGQYVMNGLTATMSDSNTFHMDPGVACMNGADVEVPAGGVDVTVTNGTQGMLRNDLICMRYTMDGPTQKESVELVCVRGTPTATDPQDPEYNDGSILDGSPVVDMPLYRVPLDGISVGDPEPLFDVLMPMADLWDSVSQLSFAKLVTDPAFEIGGVVVCGMAVVSVRWVNVGALHIPAWGSVELARVEGYRASFETFARFADNGDAPNAATRFLAAAGDTIMMRAMVEQDIGANTWHSGCVSFPVEPL